MTITEIITILHPGWRRPHHDVTVFRTKDGRSTNLCEGLTSVVSWCEVVVMCVHLLSNMYL